MPRSVGCHPRLPNGDLSGSIPGYLTGVPEMRRTPASRFRSEKAPAQTSLSLPCRAPRAFGSQSELALRLAGPFPLITDLPATRPEIESGIMIRGAVLLVACAAGLWAQKKPFDVNALLQLARVSDPQLSPDSHWVAFTVQTPDVEANSHTRHIYVVNLIGGVATKLTAGSGQNSRPRWTPDSQHILYLSDSGGSSQVWMMGADGSRPRQVTSLSTGADGHMLTPDGQTLVVTSEVYPECSDDACNKARLAAEEKTKVKARIYTTLLYRHWNQWQTARRKHLLAVPISGGPYKDLTPGKLDVPPFSLGGPDDYAVSPDGSDVCYAANTDPQPATSTNTDLFSVPLQGGEPKRITENPGADNSPVYSPDGKYLAWRSQERAGFESDRWRLMVLEKASGAVRELTAGMDRPVTGLTWAPDSARLFFTVEDRGRQTLQLIPAQGGGVRAISSGNSQIDDVQLSADGKTMIFTEQSGARPAEIFTAASSGGSPRQLSHFNDAILGAYEMPALEDFWVQARDQVRIHSFLLKPYGFDESRKYPALFLIHGGPQGAWGESWTYRWNAQVFAGAGYVVVMPNPRGSTGYGQKFTDEISGDWGGKVYDDIMAVTGYVEKLSYVDGDRMAAAGASYGGYMVNWMLGHTSRFKALVSHAGVFDLRSMFGATEELWFPLWEFRGTPWENPDMYQRWSPSNFVANFKTPTLVTHGELDFRVPYEQALSLYTSLKLRKVPAKLIVFPDEGHWIQKPQNSRLWYNAFLDWINEWTRAPAVSGR